MCAIRGNEGCDADCNGAYLCDVECGGNAHVVCDDIQVGCTATVGDGARVSCANAKQCDVHCTGACDVQCPGGSCRVSCSDPSRCTVTCADTTDVAPACADGKTKLCGLPCNEPRVLATLDDDVIDLVLDDANVYAATLTGKLVKISRTEGTAAVVSESLENRGTFVLAAGLAWHTLAIDAEAVYWTAPSAGSIEKLPLAGGDTITVASGQDEPDSLLAVGSQLYWADKGNIASVSASGGDVTVLTSFTTGLATGFVADDQHVYWASVSVDPGSAIMSCPVGGGAATVLAEAVKPSGITIAGPFLYWAEGALSLTPDHPTAAIRRVPIEGGDAVDVVTTPELPGRLASDESHLYWADNAARLVRKANLDGRDIVTLGSEGVTGPGGLAVSGGTVYWSNGPDIMVVEP